MIISVINHTHGLISDAEAQRAIRAINRQLNEDFRPHWGVSATLRLDGPTAPFQDIVAYGPHLSDARGDAVIYLWHPVQVGQALGFHALHYMGRPYGFVFPEMSMAVGEPWTASLSHEVLELLVDPEVNRMVMGPHPADPSRMVFYWYEVCDAVQAETYDIDGVEVCNFLLPLYFTSSEEPGSRNDFLNLPVDNMPLASFGVHPGGYAGYFDPVLRTHGVSFINLDPVATRRLEVKEGLELTRRSQRYQYWAKAGETVYSRLIRGFN